MVIKWMSCLFNKLRHQMGSCRLHQYPFLPILWLCSLNFLFYFCFVLREIFDELLETERNSQALSLEVGKTTRLASWETNPRVGSVHCVFSFTAARSPFLCQRRIWNSTWCGSNKQLRAKQKMKIAVMRNVPSWLFYGHFGLTSVADYPLFLLQEWHFLCLRNTCCKYIYICTYTHIHVEWMEP